MSSAPLAVPARRCVILPSLAAFERAAGFAGTACEHLRDAARCGATGCCAAPRLCRTQAPPAPARPKVIALPAARPGAGPTRGAGAACGSVLPRLPAAPPQADGEGNRVERRAVSLAALDATAGGLTLLLDYWRELWTLSRGALVDLDPIRLWQMEMLGWVHLVDVAAADPARFSIPIRGWRVPNADIALSREGMSFGDHPIRVLAESVTADYAEARATARPAYHQMRSRLAGHGYAYRRLILPLSTDGTRIDRLLVATDFG